MDNQEFDHIISNNLKTTQSFEMQTSDWEQVAAELSSQKRKKRSGFLLWWLGGATALLSLLSIYLFFQLKEANQTITQLEHRDLIPNKEQTQRPTTQETLVIVDTIIRYDTIVKQVFRLENLDVNFSEVEKSRTRPELLNEKQNLPAKAMQPSDVLIEKTIQQNIVTEQLDEADERQQFLITKTLQIPSLRWKPSKPLLILEEDFVLERTAQAIRKKRNWWNPKRLSIGVGGAWGNLYRYSSGGSIYQNEQIVKSNWSIGGGFYYQIAPRLTSYYQLSYQQLNYQTDQFEAFEGVNLGSLPQPPINYSIQSLAISQQGLQHTLGFQYHILEAKPWQAYLGLSVEASSSLSQKIVLFSESETYPVGSIERQISRKVAKLDVHSLLPTVGFRFFLSRHFSTQLEGWYRYRIKAASEQLFDQYGCRAMLLYHF